jgi:hypothetical protein
VRYGWGHSEDYFVGRAMYPQMHQDLQNYKSLNFGEMYLGVEFMNTFRIAFVELKNLDMGSRGQRNGNCRNRDVTMS